MVRDQEGHSRLQKEEERKRVRNTATQRARD